MKIRTVIKLLLSVCGISCAKSYAFVFLLTTCSAGNILASEAGLSGVIYQDTFSTNGTMSGRSVETGSGTWIAMTNLTVSGGVALPGATNPGKNALLPFTPQAGMIYTLSADVNATSNQVDLGFVADTNAIQYGNELFHQYVDTEAPWMYLAASGNLQTFSGPSTGGNKTYSGVSTNGRMRIDLDTTGTNWVAVYYFNGTAFRTNVFSGSLNINYIAFGGTPIANATVDNFELSAAPEKKELVIYQDSFSTNGTLSGKTVESGFGNWIAMTNLTVSGGVALSGATNPGKNALLPFVPRKNRLYFLSADVNATSSQVDLGFVTDTNAVLTGAEFFYQYVDTEAPWMYLAASGNLQTFSGPSTGGNQTYSGVSTNGTMMIELDTTGTNWVAIYYFNGAAFRTNVFSGSLNINYVAFGGTPIANATVDNFKLQAIEPAPEISIDFDTRPWYEIWSTSCDNDFMLKHIDELSIHNHFIIGPGCTTDAQLSNVVQTADTYGFDLTLEFGALRYNLTNADQSGESAGDLAVASLNRMTGLGGVIKRIYIDHPWELRYMDNPDFGQPDEPKEIATGMSWDQSIQEMADCIERIQQSYPGVETWLIECFVNYGWKGVRAERTLTGTSMSVGDCYQEFTQLLTECQRRGIHLDGVLNDYPYDAAAGLVDESGTVFYNGPENEYDWMARIRDWEYETEICGLDFGIINNNPIGTNTYAFYSKSLEYAKEYTGAPYNGSPALWAPWSWYSAPKHFAPECTLINGGESNYTIGVLSDALVEQVKPKEDIDGFYWGFTPDGFGDVEGWRWQAMTPPVLDGGFLKTVTTGSDAQLYRYDVSIDGNTYQSVEVALAANGGQQLHWYYQVNNGSTWYEAPAVNLTADEETHVYTVDLQDCPQWIGGTVTAVRLDPVDASGVSCWIDYIWIKP